MSSNDALPLCIALVVLELWSELSRRTINGIRRTSPALSCMKHTNRATGQVFELLTHNIPHLPRCVISTPGETP
jgi:hypothetical protein